MITDFLIPACNMVLVWRLVEHYKELSTAKMRLWYVVAVVAAVCLCACSRGAAPAVIAGALRATVLT